MRDTIKEWEQGSEMKTTGTTLSQDNRQVVARAASPTAGSGLLGGAAPRTVHHGNSATDEALEAS